MVTHRSQVVHFEKAQLADLGLIALSRGEWLIAFAITTIIQNRGWGHA
jgi:hypothetical protein